MARRKRHSPEQAIELLRKIEDGIANGKTIADSCMEAKVSKWMYLSWRNERSNAEDARLSDSGNWSRRTRI
jgi:hypothetical protein